MKLVRAKGQIMGAIGRNANTRIAHIFYGGSSHCGSSRKNVAVKLSEAEAAKPEMFCEKCFSNGKPAAFEEFSVTPMR